MMIIRLAIPTNIKIAKSGASVVGSFMTLGTLEPLLCVLWTLSNAQHIQYKSIHCHLPVQMTHLSEHPFLTSMTSLGCRSE